MLTGVHLDRECEPAMPARRHLAFSLTGLVLAIALMAMPSQAQAQFHITTEIHQGVSAPVGAGVEWQGGWEVGGGFGFAIRGEDFLIGATVIEVNYATFHGDNLPYSRFDIMMLAPQVLFVLKPVLLGIQIGAGLRITEDGHNPSDIDPESGEEITSYINFGLDVGPRMWWPINEYFALDVSLKYQLSSNEIPDTFPDPRGSPRHGLSFRLGVVFAP